MLTISSHSPRFCFFGAGTTPKPQNTNFAMIWNTEKNKVSQLKNSNHRMVILDKWNQLSKLLPINLLLLDQLINRLTVSALSRHIPGHCLIVHTGKCLCTLPAELMYVKGIFACVDRNRQEMGEKEGYDMQQESCTMPCTAKTLLSKTRKKYYLI